MFVIDPRSKAPIYEQLREQLRWQITMGFLAPDEPLPSVRTLSAELGINPNTIQKAYRQLEADRYIYTVSGLGCFVSEKPEAPDLSKAAAIYEAIEDNVKQLRYLGVAEEEIRARLEEIACGKGVEG